MSDTETAPVPAAGIVDNVPESIKTRMITSYPTISGMTAEFLTWHATPEERDEAWQRCMANRHLRTVVEVTMRARRVRSLAEGLGE